MNTLTIDKRIIPSVFDKLSVMAYKIYTGYIFLALQISFTAWAFITDKPFLLLQVMLIIGTVQLLTCRDVMATTATFLLAVMALLAQYGVFVDDFILIWPYTVCVVVAFIVRFFIYRTVFVIGKLFWCTLAVAVAILISGIGQYSIKEYLNPVTLYYYLGLSLGIVFLYLWFRNYMYNDSNYKPIDALSRIMIAVTVMGCIMILNYAIPRLITRTPWSVQWSNNLSTFFLISVPFVFYRGIRSRFGIIYQLLGILGILSCFLTLSRSGMMFGLLQLIVCLVATAIWGRNINRVFSIIFLLGFFVGFVCLFVEFPEIKTFIEKSLDINPNEARVKMYLLGIDNFFKNPIFGHGVPYKGDFYFPSKGAMYWYHCSILQIFAMTGLVGLVAYGYQYIVRFKTLFNRKSLSNIFMIISFIFFEIMSLVNPGAFVPVPFCSTILILLCVCEITKQDKIPDKDLLYFRRANSIQSRKFRF